MEHGCDYVPVAIKRDILEEIPRAAYRYLRYPQQMDSRKYLVKAGGKTENNEKKPSFRIGDILFSLKFSQEKC